MCVSVRRGSALTAVAAVVLEADLGRAVVAPVRVIPLVPAVCDAHKVAAPPAHAVVAGARLDDGEAPLVVRREADLAVVVVRPALIVVLVDAVPPVPSAAAPVEVSRTHMCVGFPSARRPSWLSRHVFVPVRCRRFHSYRAIAGAARVAAAMKVERSMARSLNLLLSPRHWPPA